MLVLKAPPVRLDGTSRAVLTSRTLPPAAHSTDLSAKTGFSVAATESLSVYGELSGVFADDASYGSKAGLKWNFWFFNYILISPLDAGFFIAQTTSRKIERRK